MRVFRAVAEGTTEDFDKARKMAVALGNDLTLPGVSAKDAAEALVELGKGGMTARSR